jgi:phage/plasmid-like protein (TIGR03299 family)
MAHNLNFANGKASFMNANTVEKAWHGLGQQLDRPATSQEAIQMANLDFEVRKAPVKVTLATETGSETKEVPAKFATYRTDTNTPFGVVGSRYEIVQNSEAFSFFDAIVGEGEAIYETAGALGNGETIFISAKLPGHIAVKNKDEIEKYLLLVMAHDGSRSIQAMFTPVRAVCANTVAAALRNCSSRIAIRHTKSAKYNLEQAHKIMGITNQLAGELGHIFNDMASHKLNDKEVARYIDNLFLTREEMARLAKGDFRTDVISSRKANEINAIQKYYFTGVGQDMETCKGTLFGAYNAVTGYFQNTKSYKDKEHKMKSLVLGTDSEMSVKALTLASTLIY